MLALVLQVALGAPPPPTIEVEVASKLVIVQTEARPRFGSEELAISIRDAVRTRHVDVATGAAAHLSSTELRNCDAQDRLTCWGRLARRPAVGARYLLVTHLSEDAFPWVLTAILLDLTNGSQQVVWTERAEVTDLEGTRAGLVRLVRRASPIGEERGSIVLTGLVPGASVYLDERLVGFASGPTLRLAGVKLGGHVTRVSHLGDEQTAGGQVQSGEPLTLRLRWTQKPRDASLAHRATFWGGTSAAVVGASLIVWASVATPDSGHCIEGFCAPKPRRGFATSCQLLGNQSACRASPSGPLVGALGAALVLGGAAAIIGTEWWEDDEGLPWKTWLAATLFAGLTYGFAHAFAYPGPAGS